MPELEFTGERYIPGGGEGEIAYEHWHRYAFARQFAAGRRVLDAACGEGYGTALLAGVSAQAIGVDIDESAIAHARARYGHVTHLRYEQGSVTSLPLADASVDLVVSFETIEHLPASDQPAMLAEFARVLAPGGLLLLSSPNRVLYSEASGYRNPFHLHELDRGELEALLMAFPHRRWFHQVRAYASALWSEEAHPVERRCDAWTGDGESVLPAVTPDGLYYVVLAAATADALPAPRAQVSLFSDRDESEAKRVDAATREILRLDALLKDRDAAADRQTHHIHHLEELVAYRERLVVERDAQLESAYAVREGLERDRVAARESLAGCQSELSAAQRTIATMSHAQRERDAAIAAQERLIAYRQSARWWLQLPMLRARMLWQRLSGR